MKFRKKPVEIEAMQFDGSVESANRVLAWIGSQGAAARRMHITKPGQGIVIDTLEGNMTASPGDWIICGVQGEFYPCKPDIFEATYERVPDESDRNRDAGTGQFVTDEYAAEHPDTTVHEAGAP